MADWELWLNTCLISQEITTGHISSPRKDQNLKCIFYWSVTLLCHYKVKNHGQTTINWGLCVTYLWHKGIIRVQSFEIFLCVCAGWGYTGVFTKILTIYQIYHTWIHPSTILFHFPPTPHPLPHSMSFFSQQTFWNLSLLLHLLVVLFFLFIIFYKSTIICVPTQQIRSCFQFGTIRNNTVINIQIQVFMDIFFYFFWINNLQVELLGHNVSLFLTMCETVKLFPKLVV
jgi:hypothetical protein